MYVRRCYNKFVILHDNLRTQTYKYYFGDLFILCVGLKDKKGLGTQASTGEAGKLKRANVSFKGKRGLACSSWNAGEGCSS